MLTQHYIDFERYKTAIRIIFIANFQQVSVLITLYIFTDNEIWRANM